VHPITDTVAIVSVVTSGVVGLAGLSSTAYLARAQRRWQSHEERVVDLRMILDSAGADIAQTVLALGEANWAAEQAFGEFKSNPTRRNDLLVQGRGAVVRSLAPRGSLRTTCNRLSVRMGDADATPIALLDVHSKLVALGLIVSDQLETGPDETRYNTAWDAVETAETAFFAAAARALKPPRAGRTVVGFNRRSVPQERIGIAPSRTARTIAFVTLSLENCAIAKATFRSSGSGPDVRARMVEFGPDRSHLHPESASSVQGG
jgi:hypothetical protein